MVLLEESRRNRHGLPLGISSILDQAVGVVRSLAAGSAQLRSVAMTSRVRDT
jgi:hypothetical protein